MDEHKTERVYKKKEQVFYEGSMIFGIYFICQGRLKIFKNGPGGRKQIVRLARSGDILGHRGWGLKSYYAIGAAAIEDSQVCFIENDFFTKLLKENPDFIFNLMLFYAEELKNAETRMRNLAQMTVRERVAEALLMVNGVFGKRDKKNRITLDIILTRQEIAEIAGTAQEQAIRTLSEFKQDHIIETEGKQIFLTDYDGLKKIIDDYDVA